MQFRNNADQPHFVEFQHVKQGTTNAQVRRFFKHGVHAASPRSGCRAATASAS